MKPFDTRPAGGGAVPAIALTADEQRVLAAFRAADERRKRENLELLESDAKEYPERGRPALQLVKGGAA
jgi:hypothetical protein